MKLVDALQRVYRECRAPRTATDTASTFHPPIILGAAIGRTVALRYVEPFRGGHANTNSGQSQRRAAERTRQLQLTRIG